MRMAVLMIDEGMDTIRCVQTDVGHLLFMGTQNRKRVGSDEIIHRYISLKSHLWKRLAY